VLRKKFRNQNNKDQIGQHNTINLNLKIKLKTTKTFTKGLREKKLEIQRIRTTLKNMIFGKLNWIIKLKINKIFTKRPKPKIKKIKIKVEIQTIKRVKL